MEPVVVVQDLVKRYQKATVNAVDSISFEVGAGSLFALLGPNGAGKTTTISVLTTTLQATAGRVTIAGHDVARASAAVRRQIGVIFQGQSLDPNLSGEENVRLHAVLYGLYGFRPSYRLMPRAYRDQVGELAAIVGLQDEIFRPIRTLSGGMKRKLEIVRGLIHRPRVLFLDEPTTGLDPASRRDVWAYLRQVRRETGTTIVLTTHYLEEAEDADYVCIINQGRIVARGTPAEIKAAIVQDYVLLDSPEPATLRSELRRLGHAVSSEPPFRVAVGGADVASLVRTIQAPLSLVSTHLPSLEDAYLEIIGGSRE